MELVYSQRRDRQESAELPDRDLAVRARGGDMVAFEALVTRKTSAVVSLARRIVGNGEDARDVAQMVFLRVWNEIHRYDELSRGILHFATNGHDFEVLARSAEALRALGADRQVKSAPECLELEPALSESEAPVTGGVYTPGDESGDAHRFTQELARLSAQRGVRFRYGSRLKALRASNGKVEAAVLEDGEVTADAYVVALGSYSPLLLNPLGVHVPVYPLKG